VILLWVSRVLICSQMTIPLSCNANGGEKKEVLIQTKEDNKVFEKFVIYFANQLQKKCQIKNSMKILELYITGINPYQGLYNALYETFIIAISKSDEKYQKHIRKDDLEAYFKKKWLKDSIIDDFDKSMEFCKEMEVLKNEDMIICKKLMMEFHHYTRHILLLIKRIVKNKDDLMKVFTENKKFQLDNVKFMESDIHRVEGGVSLIHLIDSENKSVRVIYKFGPCLVDYAIIADTKELIKKDVNLVLLEAGLEKLQSFAEIINSNLLESEPKIPTYIILPYELNFGSVSDRINNSYCYKQFLGYEQTELDEMIPIFNNRLSEIQDEESKELRTKMETQFRQYRFDEYKRIFGKRIIENKEYLEKEDEIDKYSIQFGYIFMLTYILRAFNQHHGNVVMHAKAPNLIDLEVAFSPHDPNNYYYNLQGRHGSFSTSSTENKKFLLHGALGEVYIKNLKTFPKSAAFVVSEDNKSVERLDINNLLPMKGIKSFYDALKKSHIEIKNWVNSATVSSVVFRELAISTGDFYKLRFKSTTEIDKEFSLPDGIFSAQDRPSYLLSNKKIASDLSKGIIPSFYGSLNGPQVFDSFGVVLNMENNESAGKDANYQILYPLEEIKKHPDFEIVGDDKYFKCDEPHKIIKKYIEERTVESDIFVKEIYDSYMGFYERNEEFKKALVETVRLII
jgi:hypothetical protein